jgi:hypothetical protein
MKLRPSGTSCGLKHCREQRANTVPNDLRADRKHDERGQPDEDVRSRRTEPAYQAIRISITEKNCCRGNQDADRMRQRRHQPCAEAGRWVGSEGDRDRYRSGADRERHRERVKKCRT